MAKTRSKNPIKMENTASNEINNESQQTNNSEMTDEENTENKNEGVSNINKRNENTDPLNTISKNLSLHCRNNEDKLLKDNKNNLNADKILIDVDEDELLKDLINNELKEEYDITKTNITEVTNIDNKKGVEKQDGDKGVNEDVEKNGGVGFKDNHNDSSLFLLEQEDSSEDKIVIDLCDAEDELETEKSDNAETKDDWIGTNQNDDTHKVKEIPDEKEKEIKLENEDLQNLQLQSDNMLVSGDQKDNIKNTKEQISDKVDMGKDEDKEYLLVTWKGKQLKIPCYHPTNNEIKNFTHHLHIVAYPIVVSDLSKLTQVFSTAQEVKVSLADVEDGGMKKGYVKLRFMNPSQAELAIKTLKSLPLSDCPSDNALNGAGGDLGDGNTDNKERVIKEGESHALETSNKRVIEIEDVSEKFNDYNIITDMKIDVKKFDYSIYRMLYVTNLNAETTESEISQEFPTCQRVLIPLQGDKPKGYAYLTYSTHKETKIALEKFKKESKKAEEWFVLPAIHESVTQMALKSDEERKSLLKQIKDLEEIFKSPDNYKDKEKNAKELYDLKSQLMKDISKRKKLGFYVSPNEIFENVQVKSEDTVPEEKKVVTEKVSNVGFPEKKLFTKKFRGGSNKTNINRRPQYKQMAVGRGEMRHVGVRSLMELSPVRHEKVGRYDDYLDYSPDRDRKEVPQRFVGHLKRLIGELPNDRILELNDELNEGVGSSRSSMMGGKLMDDYRMPKGGRQIDNYMNTNGDFIKIDRYPDDYIKSDYMSNKGGRYTDEYPNTKGAYMSCRGGRYTDEYMDPRPTNKKFANYGPGTKSIEGLLAEPMEQERGVGWYEGEDRKRRYPEDKGYPSDYRGSFRGRYRHDYS